MKKRILAFLLAAIMLIGILAACDNSTPTPSTDNQTPSTNTQTPDTQH